MDGSGGTAPVTPERPGAPSELQDSFNFGSFFAAGSASEGRGRSLKGELHDIFLAYASRGERAAEPRLGLRNWTRFAEDCCIVGGGDPGLAPAEVDLVFAKVVGRRQDSANAGRLSFSSFCRALGMLAVKVFCDRMSPPEALAELLGRHVLPLAARKLLDAADAPTALSGSFAESFATTPGALVPSLLDVDAGVRGALEPHEENLLRVFEHFSSLDAGAWGRGPARDPASSDWSLVAARDATVSCSEFLALAAHLGIFPTHVSRSGLLRTFRAATGGADFAPDAGLSFPQFLDALARTAVDAMSRAPYAAMYPSRAEKVAGFVRRLGLDDRAALHAALSRSHKSVGVVFRSPRRGASPSRSPRRSPSRAATPRELGESFAAALGSLDAANPNLASAPPSASAPASGALAIIDQSYASIAAAVSGMGPTQLASLADAVNAASSARDHLHRLKAAVAEASARAAAGTASAVTGAGSGSIPAAAWHAAFFEPKELNARPRFNPGRSDPLLGSPQRSFASTVASRVARSPKEDASGKRRSSGLLSAQWPDLEAGSSGADVAAGDRVPLLESFGLGDASQESASKVVKKSLEVRLNEERVERTRVQRELEERELRLRSAEAELDELRGRLAASEEAARRAGQAAASEAREELRGKLRAAEDELARLSSLVAALHAAVPDLESERNRHLHAFQASEEYLTSVMAFHAVQERKVATLHALLVQRDGELRRLREKNAELARATWEEGRRRACSSAETATLRSRMTVLRKANAKLQRAGARASVSHAL
eukprot:tig00000983_g5916.t1